MYDLTGYGVMVADEKRVEAYAEALSRTVGSDSVVLDVGTGTGIFALIACQLGARKVYAIEPGTLIQVARDIAQENAYADRIEFIQDFSTRVDLPERADVMVSDLRGVLPLCGKHLPSVLDARKRLLTPRGELIPRRDTLWIAAVEAPELYKRTTAPWDDKPCGFSMKAASNLAIHLPSKARVRPEQLVTEPLDWATLEYATVESSNLEAKVETTVARAATAHGLDIWFDTLLAEGVGFSNAPGQPELIYGSMFFPWPRPVDVRPGDEIRILLEAKLIGEDYVWRWNTTIRRKDEVKASFQQSTFRAEPVSPESLRKRAATHRPKRSEAAEVDHFVLSLMNGQARLEDIAQRLCEQFPTRFFSWQEALDYVSRLSLKYSQ